MTQPAAPSGRGLTTTGWLPLVLRTTFRSWDFRLGTAAGLAVALFGEFKTGVLENAVVILVTDVLLGAALLAVVLAALAILVTFFDDYFRKVIEVTTGGVQALLLSYQIVAVVGGAAAATGVFGATLWPVLPHWLKATTLGVVTQTTIWAVVGTYQLVGLTIFLGRERSRLMEGVEAAEGLLSQRRHQRKSA